jgi:hypothetical protein
VLVEDFNSQPPDAADAAEWVDAFGLPFDVVYDAEQITAGYEPDEGLPASWLLDRDGRVVWIHRGKGALEELEAQLDDL